MGDRNFKDSVYIHIAFIIIFVSIVYILIRAVFIVPLEKEKKLKELSFLSTVNMVNIFTAENLFKKKHNYYTDNIDSLIHFVNTDVEKKYYDSLFNKNKNGEFILDSIKFSPLSRKSYILKTDKEYKIDTIFNKLGKPVRIDSVAVRERIKIVCPDGFGKLMN